MFGRHPRLPVDIVFGLADKTGDTKGYSQYVKQFKDRMKHAYDLASSSMQRAKSHQKVYYDSRVRGAVIRPGDRVLVRSVGLKGKHKIADKWLSEVYIVREQPNLEIPVYLVHRKDGRGKDRLLHRNLLLPISSLPIPAQLDKLKQSVKEAKAEIRERDQDPEPEDPGDSDDGDESIAVFDAMAVPMPRCAPVPAPGYRLRNTVPNALPDASSDQFQGEDPASSPDNALAGDTDTDTESDIPTVLSGEYSLDRLPMGLDIVTTPGSDVQPVDQSQSTPDSPRAPTPRPRRVRHCPDRYGSNIYDMSQSVYPPTYC